MQDRSGAGHAERAAAGLPQVTVDGHTIVMEWPSATIRCSADEAHALSDLLFELAIQVDASRMRRSGADLQ